MSRRIARNFLRDVIAAPAIVSHRYPPGLLILSTKAIRYFVVSQRFRSAKLVFVLDEVSWKMENRGQAGSFRNVTREAREISFIKLLSDKLANKAN